MSVNEKLVLFSVFNFFKQKVLFDNWVFIVYPSYDLEEM